MMTALRSFAAVLLLAIGCGPAAQNPTSPPRPSELLVDDPPLPAQLQHSTESGDTREIEWRLFERARRVDKSHTQQCQRGVEERLRVWTHEGALVADAEFDQWVCGFRTEADAQRSFQAVPASHLAGEDWPALEEHSPEELAPSGWTSGSVSADPAQLLCFHGDAEGLCWGWLYRGVYGRYVVTLRLHAGNDLEAFEDLVLAVDRHVVAVVAGD